MLLSLDCLREQTSVEQLVEKGGTFAPPPVIPTKSNQGMDLGSMNRKKLLWMNEDALRESCRMWERGDRELRIFKQVKTANSDALAGRTGDRTLLRPTLEKSVEVKVTPETHMGYAFTWFSLSAVGTSMTYQLLKRGVK